MIFWVQVNPILLMKFTHIFVIRCLSSNIILNKKHMLFSTVCGLTQTQRILTAVGHKTKCAMIDRNELVTYCHSVVPDSVYVSMSCCTLTGQATAQTKFHNLAEPLCTICVSILCQISMIS